MTIQELISITDYLNKVLNQVSNHNRDESIQLINKILINRQEVLEQLDLNLVKTDPLMDKLLLDEASIRTKMDYILNDIKKDIQELGKKKLLGGNYINPYKSLRINGAFIDRKY